jgi:hypothetical protein
MNKSTTLALSIAAALMSATAVNARPITYQFTGTTFAGGALDGQSLSGTYTYDPSLYASTFTDGSTLNQRYVDGAPLGSAYGSIRLSGGFATSFGDADSQLGVSYQTIVQKDHAGQDLFELYGASVDASGGIHALALLTQQSSLLPDLIYAGSAPGDLSVTQPVSFLTPYSSNVGYFALIGADGSVIASDFSITQISAVPEASTISMLLAGAGLMSLRLRRRTRG